MMKTKILIVDDLRENIMALSRLIEADDVEILTASKPEDALNHILDNDFALALLDVQMPMMSGFELARLIRGVAKGKHLPIIFVTAQPTDTKVIFEGYESGAVDVLFKPLDPHIVRSKVRVFVRLDQQSRTLLSQVEVMARLKEEADAANIAKSRFLANMSHEIRTPMGAVLGFADVLSQADLNDDERTQALASISRNGKLLLRIIDDILDLSRIEAQKLDLEKVGFDLNELMADLETTLSAKALEKGISLTIDKDKEANSHLVSDPLRVKQILLNLIGNAIKFTHSGSVKVGVEKRLLNADEGSQLAEIRFEIQDTGIGLSREEAERLFVPFAQADTSVRRKYGGTGLGLAISKQLAKSLGGDLILKASESGKGSNFEVRIRAPLALPSETPIGLREKKPLRDPNAPTEGKLVGRKILVVDDVADNRILLERYLRSTGIQMGMAASGQEALDSIAGREWDAILMDIQMPEMDGLEATRRLRELGYHKPIIALTAHAMREELDRCINAGCDSTMTKPVAKKDLIQKLEKMLND